MTYLDFRLSIARNLIEQYHVGGRKSRTPAPLRLQGKHYPKRIPPTAKKSRPSQKCFVCCKKGICKCGDVPLCVYPCFEAYHCTRNIKMVMVSGRWVSNVAYPSSGDLIFGNKMAAKAVLICRPNSHPFQERSLTLDQPVKIGRSVARARAAPNNAIFDCKVLSRNHALLWYENGKFYLQDTKSSNGTFVNNQRLSKGAEESPPREVCSGDIVQFGVDVMENSRKVTHGCIVATLKLYLPDGKEAKASPSTSVVSSVGMVPLEDLYQLNQYLQEALQREQVLENKLATLQRLVETTRQATDLGWKALIDEDRLLSRVEILENQLQMYSKNFAEDKLREELRKLQEDKCQYQGAAKESLRKILQEKLDTVQRLQDLERTLNNTEFECAHLKERCERNQQDLQEMALKYSQQLQKVEDLSSKLQETEEQNREVCERLELEKLELQARLQEQLEAERALQLRLEVVQEDGELTQRQLQALQSRLHTLQVNDDDIDTKQDLDSIKAMDSTGTQVDIILERIEPGMQDNMKEALQNTEEEIVTLLSRLKISEEELKERHAKVDQLHHQVELTQLKGQQRKSEVARIRVQIEESRCLEDESSEHLGELLEQKEDLELQLNQIQAKEEEKTAGELEGSSDAVKLKAEIVHLEELLAEAREKKVAAELQKEQYELDLDIAELKEKKTMEEVNLLKQQLQAAQSQMQEKSESVSKLHEKMQWLESSADEVKLQALSLQEQLSEEQQKSIRYFEESEKLRKQLVETQQCVKQSHNEAEQMKDRLKAIQEELEKKSDREDNHNQEEIARLRQRCQMLEEDNARLKERCRRTTEQKVIVIRQETRRPGDAGDTSDVPDSMQSLSSELAACRLEKDQVTQEIQLYQEELVALKERYAQSNELQAHLMQELNTLREEYSRDFSSTSFMIWCSVLPLVIVFLGLVSAFYPTLAVITGTLESEEVLSSASLPEE